MFQTCLSGNQTKDIILTFKKSGDECMEIPGRKGMFITCDSTKGESVIYIAQEDVDGETYYLYHMNPLY